MIVSSVLLNSRISYKLSQEALRRQLPELCDSDFADHLVVEGQFLPLENLENEVEGT